MTAETLLHKGLRDDSGFVHEQLRFDAMNSWGLLQSFDHMGEQPRFHLVGIGQAPAVRNKKISNNTLAAFVNKERIAENSSAIDGRITRQNLGVDVAQNHVGGSAVIPGEQARPYADLVLQQGTQVDGGKMPEIENLHAGSWRVCL